MIQDNLKKIQETIPSGVTLVAVSKTKPAEMILDAYAAGQRHFGENKVQELTEKQEQLPKDIYWHLIGHLQTNKVKYIAPFVHLIHAVDSLKLLKEINKQAKKNNRIISCLLQFHIATEDTKFGMTRAEVEELINSDAYQEMENVKLCGVMGMATLTDNESRVREEFHHLKNEFEYFREKYFSDTDQFSVISMGMSGDYQLAIEEGSTMVRVGSSIFGQR
ncbi:YggS family pyridoxal phosphate-dependent enzyme [Wandonia haliotis]|uniref:Pyridoxal phosphate homeostasis protein n=1 Tax=Wandonia haliotis TaxID=574963 RepID=A0ABN1MPK5_9FLAO